VAFHRRALSGVRFLDMTLSLLAVDLNRHLDRAFVFLFHARHPVAPKETVDLLAFRLALSAGFGFDLDFDTLVFAVCLSGFSAVSVWAVDREVVNAVVELSTVVAFSALFKTVRSREEAQHVSNTLVKAFQSLVRAAELVVSPDPRMAPEGVVMAFVFFVLD